MRWKTGCSDSISKKDAQGVQEQTWFVSHTKKSHATWEGCKRNIWTDDVCHIRGSKRILKWALTSMVIVVVVVEDLQQSISFRGKCCAKCASTWNIDGQGK